MKILIIEDDEGLCEVLTSTFLFEGENEVRSHGSLAAGLLSNREFRPNLIILDLMLTDAKPHQSIEAITELRADNPDASILIYSGQITPELEARAIELGAKAVRQKGSTSTSWEILEAAKAAVMCSSGDCKTFLAHTMAILANRPVNA